MRLSLLCIGAAFVAVGLARPLAQNGKTQTDVDTNGDVTDREYLKTFERFTNEVGSMVSKDVSFEVSRLKALYGSAWKSAAEHGAAAWKNYEEGVAFIKRLNIPERAKLAALRQYDAGWKALEGSGRAIAEGTGRTVQAAKKNARYAWDETGKAVEGSGRAIAEGADRMVQATKKNAKYVWDGTGDNVNKLQQQAGRSFREFERQNPNFVNDFMAAMSRGVKGYEPTVAQNPAPNGYQQGF